MFPAQGRYKQVPAGERAEVLSPNSVHRGTAASTRCNILSRSYNTNLCLRMHQCSNTLMCTSGTILNHYTLKMPSSSPTAFVRNSRARRRFLSTTTTIGMRSGPALAPSQLDVRDKASQEPPKRAGLSSSSNELRSYQIRSVTLSSPDNRSTSLCCREFHF